MAISSCANEAVNKPGGRMQEAVRANPDEQVEHHLKRFVDAFGAHRDAVSQDEKRSARNIKADCELALVKAYKARPAKSKPER
jgi:hypothetical protein